MLDDAGKREEDFIETIKTLSVAGFWVLFIAYGIPSLICLLINFSKLVIFGGYTRSEFDWGYYSYGEVNRFYEGIYYWIKDLSYRLQH